MKTMNLCAVRLRTVCPVKSLNTLGPPRLAGDEPLSPLGATDQGRYQLCPSSASLALGARACHKS